MDDIVTPWIHSNKRAKRYEMFFLKLPFKENSKVLYSKYSSFV